MRVRFTRRRYWSLATLLVLVVALLVARGPRILEQVFRPAPAPAEGWYWVVRAVDGDTLELDHTASPRLEHGERVRLIGVDTPETVHPQRAVEHFGREATAFTRSLAEGRRVRLEFDPAAGRDPYGRTLAYVYLEDGTFLNAEIIRQGYGFAETRWPHAYLEEFRGLEREARDNRRGLWARE